MLDCVSFYQDTKAFSHDFGLVHLLKTIQLIELMVIINLLSDYQSWLAATLKISNQKTQFTSFQVIKPHFVGEKTFNVSFDQPFEHPQDKTEAQLHSVFVIPWMLQFANIWRCQNFTRCGQPCSCSHSAIILCFSRRWDDKADLTLYLFISCFSMCEWCRFIFMWNWNLCTGYQNIMPGKTG